MAQDTNIGPIELTDDELKAVAGGFSVTSTNSSFTNSFNNTGNISLSNSTINNSSLS